MACWVHGSMFWRYTYRTWKAKCRLPAATGSLLQHEGVQNRLHAATRGVSKRASTQTCVMVQRYAALIERGEFRSDKRQAGVIRVLSAILSALVDRQPFEGHSAGNASLDARKVKGLYM